MRSSYWRGLVVGAAVTFGLGACGSGGAKSNGIANMTPDQIVQQVEHAMNAERTVHISGDVVTSGSPTVQLDVVDGQTKGGGTITIGGSPLSVVVDGSTFYLKGDAAAWTALTGNASEGQLLGGKWLKTDTSNSDFSQLAALLTIPQLVTALGSGPTPAKGPVTNVDGVSVLTLTTSDGTSYVATTGSPLLISSKGNGGSGGSGTLTFNGYNSSTVPADPSGAIDLSSLGGSGG